MVGSEIAGRMEESGELEAAAADLRTRDPGEWMRGLALRFEDLVRCALEGGER
jgi:hypothetical protein